MKRILKNSLESSLKSDINVTPFVDVMLVLLIVFMVATPMIQQGITIDVPKTNAGKGSSVDQQPLVVKIDQKERILFQEKPQASSELLLQQLASHKGERIFLHAHRTLPYERVMQLIGKLSSKGFGVVLVTDNIS